MKGGTRKTRRIKGRGKEVARSEPTRRQPIRDTKIKDVPMFSSKAATLNASRRSRKQKVKNVIKNILKKNEIRLDKPLFSSILAGDLYKYFYSKETETGPYNLFINSIEQYRGRSIPATIFETHYHKNMIEKLKGTILLLQADLKTLENIPNQASSKTIPSIEDDLSGMLGKITFINS